MVLSIVFGWRYRMRYSVFRNTRYLGYKCSFLWVESFCLHMFIWSIIMFAQFVVIYCFIAVMIFMFGIILFFLKNSDSEDYTIVLRRKIKDKYFSLLLSLFSPLWVIFVLVLFFLIFETFFKKEWYFRKIE